MLEVVALSGRPHLYRVLSDDRIPALFDCRQFETVSTHLPSNWVNVKNEYGEALRPGNWARPGFWEAFLAGDQHALRDFYDALPTLSQEIVAQ